MSQPRSLDPQILGRVLGACITLLVGAYVATQIVMFVFGHDEQFGVRRLFDLSLENNLPTWYASSSLLFAALLLAYIANVKSAKRDRFASHWWILAAFFVFLSADEAASLHEMTTFPLRETLGLSGIFYFAWVIPWSCIAIAALLILLRFLASLPRPMLYRFVIAGAIFVSGAIGVELIESVLDEQKGSRVLLAVLVLIEETMEMAGVALFVTALSNYIANYLTDDTIPV